VVSFRAGLSLVLVGILGAPAGAAWAAENSSERLGITSFALGAGAVAPLGNTYVALGSAPQFNADLYINHAWLGPEWDIRFSGWSAPFSVRNIPGASANLLMLGLLAGLEFHSPGSVGHVSPYFGLQVGTTYVTMTFTNSGITGTSQDAAFSFAARVAPGLEIPFSSSFSLMFDVSVIPVVGKASTIFVGSNGSLRFRL